MEILALALYRRLWVDAGAVISLSLGGAKMQWSWQPLCVRHAVHTGVTEWSGITRSVKVYATYIPRDILVHGVWENLLLSHVNMFLIPQFMCFPFYLFLLTFFLFFLHVMFSFQIPNTLFHFVLCLGCVGSHFQGWTCKPTTYKAECIYYLAPWPPFPSFFKRHSIKDPEIEVRLTQGKKDLEGAGEGETRVRDAGVKHL